MKETGKAPAAKTEAAQKEKELPRAGGGAGEESFDAGQSEKDKKEKKDAKRETAKLQKQLESAEEALAEKEKALREKEDKYLRMLAEYENFRRRAKEEKDASYAAAAADVLGNLLPVFDNLERAAGSAGDLESVRKGVKMTLSQFHAALEKLGISEIPCEKFDPALHNAVIHVEDESRGEGEIVEVLQKGYKKGEKVIRYAMVKVAN